MRERSGVAVIVRMDNDLTKDKNRVNEKRKSEKPLTMFFLEINCFYE